MLNDGLDAPVSPANSANSANAANAEQQRDDLSQAGQVWNIVLPVFVETRQQILMKL